MSDEKQNKSTLQQRIATLAPWFHNLRLQGIETAPEHFLGDYPEVKFDRFRNALPMDLSGMTVLDIGCNAGFYSLEMKRRGASRVLGIDTDPRYLEQARLAAEVSGLKIEFCQMSVWEIAKLGKRFDLVIFMGVFYHLRHPLLALDLIHEHVAKDLFLFQSMQRGSRDLSQVAEDYKFEEIRLFEAPSFPQMYFIEQKYCNDETNWWIPNRSGMEAMLRSAGFEVQDQPEEEVYLCRWKEISTPPDGPHSVYPAAGPDTGRHA